jgi:hypothetical protein
MHDGALIFTLNTDYQFLHRILIVDINIFYSSTQIVIAQIQIWRPKKPEFAGYQSVFRGVRPTQKQVSSSGKVR